MPKRKILSGMAAILCSLAMALAPAGAGNRKMIEKRIVELDRINQQVVGRLPDLPKDGRVTFRARVLPDGAVLGPGSVQTVVQTSFPAVDDDELLTLSDAIRRHARHSGHMRPYRDANSDGAYTPLAAGLRQRHARDRRE